jgi:hypothetical protein
MHSRFWSALAKVIAAIVLTIAQLPLQATSSQAHESCGVDGSIYFFQDPFSQQVQAWGMARMSCDRPHHRYEWSFDLQGSYNGGPWQTLASSEGGTCCDIKTVRRDIVDRCGVFGSTKFRVRLWYFNAINANNDVAHHKGIQTLATRTYDVVC